MISQSLKNLLGQNRRALFVGVGHDDGKFFSPISVTRIARSYAGFEYRPEFKNNFIPDRMTMVVINPFEIVDIEQKQAEWVVRLNCGPLCFGQQLFEVTPCIES